MPKRITITIPLDPEKPTTIDVEGHSGPGCQKLTEAIQAALGTTTDTILKAEFHQQEQQEDQQQMQ